MDVIFFVVIGIALLVLGVVLLVRPNASPDTKFGGATLPVGVVVLISGLVCAGYPFSMYYRSPNVVPAPTATASPSATAAPTGTAIATPVPIAITSPPDGAEIKPAGNISGTAPNLGENELWTFEWAEHKTVADKVYYVYYRTSDAPIDIANGSWSTDIGELGETGSDIGETFIVKLVRASPECSNVIANLTPNPAGEIFLEKLPSGCEEVGAPHRLVKKS
ncbi:MAG: hypothetical protein ACRDRP_09165 [Pseudonocardiaceae bacterium]